MKKFQGITTKTDKNNNTQIMVRFMYEGKHYPVKNFTKLFGCKTKIDASKKLGEIKVMISKGQNPFVKTENNLNEIFKNRIEQKRNSGKWAEHTISNYQLFYDLEMKQKIGHKKLEKITKDDLLKIVNDKEFSNKKSVWRSRLKQILNPIFKESIKGGLIYVNPCDVLENEDVDETENVIDKIEDDDILYISQELYKAIKKYPCKTKSQKPEYECYLYLILLCGRRIGETCKLERKHCFLKTQKIISPKEITKSKKQVEFPIPDECIDYISSIDDGKLFPNIKRESVYLMFQRLLKYTNIELLPDKILTVHNTRDLLLNNMIENGVDSRLADYCLDHKQQGTIQNYLKFSFTQQKEAFELYWGLVRNNDVFLKEKEKFRKEFYRFFELEFEKEWDKKRKELEKNSQK